MDSDSWANLFSSNAIRRFQSRLDLFGHDEIEGDDEIKAEFLCPFCAEEFDVVGLCCHIDEEHPLEAKNGVCPVCAKRVGANLVTHITTQHGSLLKRKRKFRRGSNSTFSILRKELREGSLQALLGGSSFAFPSSTEPDPLLSSFIYNAPDEHVSEQPHPLVEAQFMKESIKEEVSERIAQQPPLSTKDQRRRLGSVSLYKDCLCPPFLMTYKLRAPSDRSLVWTQIPSVSQKQDGGSIYVMAGNSQQNPRAMYLYCT